MPGQLRGLRTAAVNEHDPDADLVQDADLLHQGPRLLGVDTNTSPPAFSTNTLRLNSRM